MQHLVLGTAGHIDHGKSALVQALTGTDPDRLVEEKRRGITIELGFADAEIAPGQVVSFVDVPGHERFVRHMVAGATGIDAVMLVVAADQGVQPQTREHLAICSLLGLQRGVVALSKIDLVEEDLREVAAMEVGELLAGTFLAGAPLIGVSSRSGEGIDRLRESLSALFEQVRARPEAGVPRLPVDRSFVLRGFGSVVTGTLVSGALNEGQLVQILPGEKRGKIRGLQVHHQTVDRAAAGRRVAVNLQGVDSVDVPRGATITHPGALVPTKRVWARLELLPGVPRSLERGGEVRLHQGTCERAARYRSLSRGSDGAFHVEVFLAEPTVLVPGDRFILRRPAPVDTVGGGVIVDVRPPHARAATEASFRLEALEPEQALLARLERAGTAGRDATDLAAELGWTSEQLGQRLARLDEAGRIRSLGSSWFDAGAWGAAEQRVVKEVGEFHDREPLSLGMPREALRARAFSEMPQDVWRRLLEGLESAGAIRLEGELVAGADHEIVLGAEEGALSESIERCFRDAGLQPPELAQALPDADPARATKIVALLVARGRLVRLPDGKLFHADAIAELMSRLARHAKSSPTIDVGTFKDLAGVTRKNAIPLLEYLDARRITRRDGNLRRILDSGAGGVNRG